MYKLERKILTHSGQLPVDSWKLRFASQERVQNFLAKRWDLREQFNFTQMPGFHSSISPVVGSRANEYFAARRAYLKNPGMEDFERAVYCPTDLIFIIPYSKRSKADDIAEEMFLLYISRYYRSGITRRNIIKWVKPGTPKACPDSVRICGTNEKPSVWHVIAEVGDRTDVENGRISPRMIIAQHEVMHLEETPVGATPEIHRKRPREILTRLKSIVLLDEIYKRVHGISIEEEVDYNKTVEWNKGRISLGALANFYRRLENRYGSIGKAVVSPESLNLINGRIHDPRTLKLLLA